MAERWKHDGVRVIPGDSLDPNVPQTAAWTGGPESVAWVDPIHSGA